MLGWKLQGDTLRSQRGRGVSKGPHGPGAKSLGRAFRPWAQTLPQTATRQLPHGLRASADAELMGSSWGHARDACLRRAGAWLRRWGPAVRKPPAIQGSAALTHVTLGGRGLADVDTRAMRPEVQAPGASTTSLDPGPHGSSAPGGERLWRFCVRQTGAGETDFPFARRLGTPPGRLSSTARRRCSRQVSRGGHEPEAGSGQHEYFVWLTKYF